MNTRHFSYSDQKTEFIAGGICLFFLLIAYLSHLGYIPLNDGHDEARRALVSTEMMLSGDYITPTINGELYFNKPPLYNWIIIAFFKLTGSQSMFVFRLPVIVASVAMGFLVYFFTKKYVNRTVAFFTAFAFLTNGRLLIYDSLHGLIDSTFACMVYLNFMLIYFYGEKKKYYHLFLASYLLTALCFMMKGIPALAFQGITLLTYFTWKKKFKILFHPAHFAGLGLLLLLPGSYYLVYFSKNDVSPVVVFSVLLNQSYERTAANFSVKESFFAFILFPFLLLYHFAPWTVFIFSVFQKGVFRKIKQNDFLCYSALTCTANILLYWFSPEVYARYLFMFLPLLYSLCFYLFFEYIKENSWQNKTFFFITVISCFCLFIAFTIIPFLDVVKIREFLFLKCFLLAAAFGLLLWFAFKFKSVFLYALLMTIILVRIAFNLFVLDERTAPHLKARSMAYMTTKITYGKPLYILHDSKTVNSDALSFYISKQRGEILRMKKDFIPGAFYITDLKHLIGKNYTSYFTYDCSICDSLMLVKAL